MNSRALMCHGIVNLIMNEYACYGRGHTIHSSGQIEWFKNSVDDRSVQVGGKQRICTIDGYSMPLVCRGGFMYLSLLGKPSDEDLERYPAVHLTGPQEWDPSVLDFCYPSGDGKPPWSNDSTERFALDPSFDEFRIGQSKLSISWMIHPDKQPLFLSLGPANMFLGLANMFSIKIPLIMKNSGLILVGSMLTLFRKPLNSPPNGEFHFPTHFL